MTEYGRYELMERIGQGALTEVFKAKRYGVEGFEKVLVVKRLKESLCTDQELVQRFIQCAQGALRLSHSNLVHVLDLGEVEHQQQKSYFLATELVSGATLLEVLDLRRELGQPLPLEMALYIAAEICRALDHAHRRQDSSGKSLGIAHGNLTAQNVFLSDEGEVKVSDFCSAALSSNRAPSSSAAPESSAAARPSVQADLGKLGELLFEMLRLSPPPAISPEATFVGFGLPVDDLLGRLLMGAPDFGAAEAHEQLLMYAYACRDWVGADQVAQLVAELVQARPERQQSYPPEIPNTQSSRPPPLATHEPATGQILGDFRHFVGRSRETNQVGRRLAIVAHRKLQGMGIVGSPGIGKSRFVVELRRRLQRGGLNLAFYIVRCPAGGRSQPYSGIVSMLRMLFALVGAESVDSEALVVALRSLGLSGPRADAILCELGARPMVDGSAPPLRAAVERVFSSLADDRMHVFAWDDASDLDEASIELLVAAAEELASKRIALMFAARKLPSTRFSSIAGFEEIELGPLDDAALSRLTQLRLGVSELPSDLEQAMSSRTRGNPMCAEELLREAVTSGAIRVEDSKVVGHDLSRASLIPDSLATQIANRVRRLDDRELIVLRLVARLDQWAKVERIAGAIGETPTEVESLLRGLAEQGLVIVEEQRPRLPSRLVDEALVVDATPDQIAALELRAGEALLAGSPDDARLLEQAALHLEAAGEPVAAAETYERAARARAENARPERTVPLILRALELVPLETRSVESVAGAIGLLAASPQAGGEQVRLSDMVRRLSAHLVARGDVERGRLIDMLLDLVKVKRSTLHFHEAQQLLLRIQALSKKDQGRLAKVLLELADTQIALGDFAPAIETLARFDALEQTAASDLQHEALVLRAHAYAQAGECATSLELLERADGMASADDASKTFRVAQVRGLASALGGMWQDSGDAALKAATAARALGRPRQEAAYRHYEGEALTQLGRYPKAYAAFRGSLAISRDIGSERWINKNRMALAYLEAREGSQLGKRQVSECIALAEQQRETQDVAKGHLLLGLLLRLDGDEAAAQRELALARQVSVAIGHGLLIAECNRAIKGDVPNS